MKRQEERGKAIGKNRRDQIKTKRNKNKFRSCQDCREITEGVRCDHKAAGKNVIAVIDKIGSQSNRTERSSDKQTEGC